MTNEQPSETPPDKMTVSQLITALLAANERVKQLEGRVKELEANVKLLSFSTWQDAVVDLEKERDQLRAELAAVKQGLTNEEHRVRGFIDDVNKLRAENLLARKCVESYKNDCECGAGGDCLAAYDKFMEGKV